jgi:hypothetical protein
MDDRLAAKIAATKEAQRLQLEKLQDIETAGLQLAEDLKYPVDVYGNVLDLNHLPDLPPTLVYHLVRRGWRRDDSKALIKPRKVVGAGFYEDLVAYVPMDATDEPVMADAPKPDFQTWSVQPTVNVIDEERPA